MGLLGKIIKTGVRTATLPIDVVRDVITLGGNKRKTNTEQGLDALIEALEELGDEIDDL
jgi:hypothetical protein